MATYELKPRLNRLTGVSTVVVQGGQEPEFEVQPDPAKLLQTAVTVPAFLDAIGRSNMIDSPGMIESNHQLVLSLVSGQARTPEQIANIVVKTTPAGAPVHVSATWRRCCLGDAGLHHRDGQWKAGGSAEHQPAAGQQHGARWPTRFTRKSRASGRRCRTASMLQPFYDQSEIVKDVHQERARRDSDRAGAGVLSSWFCSCATGALRWWRGW